MSDTTYVPEGRASRGDWWHLAAIGLGLIFGYLCLRWTPTLAFEAAVALSVLLICAARPYTGVLLALGLALSLEQYAIITGNPAISLDTFTLTLGEPFFANLKAVTRLPGLYFNFMELMLIVAAVSWTVSRLRAGTLQWRGGVLTLPSLILGVALMGAVGVGIANGGDTKIAFSEARYLLRFLFIALLAAHLIERRSQVRALVWTIIAAITLRVLIAWWHTVVDVRFNLGLVDAVAPHEDALFFASLIMLWASLTLFQTEARQRLTLGALMLAVVVALVASKRRAGMAALVMAVPFLIAVLDWRRARRAALVCIALAFPLALYLAAFWNSTGFLALPAELARSVTSLDARERHGSSNRFRVLENRILTTHVREHPVQGIGFGHPYRAPWQVVEGATDKRASLPELGYESELYIPHNQIYWVWAKTGTLGFMAFWFFIVVAVAQGTRLARALKSPYFRALAATTVALVCMQMIVSFVDTQLTGHRNIIYLGMMLGMLIRLPVIERAEEREAIALARRRAAMQSTPEQGVLA